MANNWNNDDNKTCNSIHNIPLSQTPGIDNPPYTESQYNHVLDRDNNNSHHYSQHSSSSSSSSSSYSSSSSSSTVQSPSSWGNLF